MVLDKTDFEILDLLQSNARIRYSSIADQVHLSLTAVTKRIQRLEDTGVILGYRTLINPRRLGYEVHGYLIGGVYKHTLDSLFEYTKTVKEIVRVETIVSGGKEVVIEFYCRNMDELMQFYKSRLRSFLDSMTVYLVKSVPDKDEALLMCNSGDFFNQ